MDQYIFDLAKSLLAAGGGTFGGWLLSRRTAKKVITKAADIGDNIL